MHTFLFIFGSFMQLASIFNYNGSREELFHRSLIVFFSEISVEIAKPLSIIIYKSIKTDLVPGKMKEAYIRIIIWTVLGILRKVLEVFLFAQ